MDNKEIMQNFEETFAQPKKENVVPYKASRNLNTAIGNPTMDINNNMTVNINDDEKIDNTMTTNTINNEVDHIVNPVVEPIVDVKEKVEKPIIVEPSIANEELKMDVTEQRIIKEPLKDAEVKYKTTYVSNQNIANKKKRTKVVVSNEVKIALIISLILFIFILIIPTISDFFRELRMGLNR